MQQSESAPEVTPGDTPDESSRYAYDLKAGDHDSDLNKTVHDAVMVSDTFVVYLADDLSIQWKTSADHQWTEGSGEVLNRVAILEARARFIHERGQLEPVKRQIAEGLVRCLDDGDIDGANAILTEAESEIQARNREISWSWYFASAYKVTCACVVAFGVLWLARENVSAIVGETGLHLLLGTLCGSFGALLSTTARGNRIDVDANAGRSMHVLEGLSRVGAGLIGAGVIALAIKSGFLLGGTRFDGNKLALLLMFCTIAGASERLVPNLIERVEKTAQASSTDATTTDKKRTSSKRQAKRVKT
jgi:hypothetical protein